MSVTSSLDNEVPQVHPSTTQLRSMFQVWERIILEVFGEEAMMHIDHFGRFTVLRQKRIFLAQENILISMYANK